MSDQASGTNEIYRTLECPVCFEIYNPPDKTPKSLTCGHTFCSQCLGNVMASGKVKCSQCREKTSIPQGNVDKLPTNFIAMQMLESTWQKCRVKQWVHRCDHCSQKLCEACKLSHTEEQRQDLRDELVHTKKTIQDLDSLYADDAIFYQIHLQEQAAEKDVINFYDNIQKRLQLRQEADLHKLHQHSQKVSKVRKDWQINFKASSNQAVSAIGGCQTKFEASHSKDKDKIQQEVKQECQQVLHDIKKCIANQPTLDLIQVNSPIAEVLFDYILNNGVVNIVNTKNHEEMNMNMNLPKLDICPSGHLTRTRPDYKSATLNQSYGQKGSGQGEFNFPIGIATSPVTGNVVVCDRNNRRVHYLTSNLQPLYVYGTERSHHQNPYGVAVSNRGKVFFSDTENQCIHVTDEKSNFSSVIKSESESFNFPHGIAVDDNGLLYVCDSDTYRIHILKEDGSLVRKFGSKGTKPGQFERPPAYIAVSSENKIFVTGRSILPGDCGSLYIFTHQGEHIRTIKANLSGSFTKARGVAVDPYGNIVVVDQAGQLVVLQEGGQSLCHIATSGTGPGQLQNPQGVTLTADGDILVCDAGNHRILKFLVPQITC